MIGPARPLLALALLAACAVCAAPLPTQLRELDAFLQQRESQYRDLRPDSARRVVWADPRQTRTRLSLVYLHGFSASPQEVAPLCDLLARALHANLYYSRLPGHGRGGEAMAQETLDDWMREGDEAVAIGALLGEQTVLIGTSTGGTLATWLAAKNAAPRVTAVVLLSPNFGVQAGGAWLLAWPGGLTLARIFIGPYRSFQAHNAAHARHWTTRYPVAALKPMAQLVERVNALDLSQVAQPVLMLYSTTDKVVRADAIEQRFRGWGAKQKQLQAVLTQDPDRHVLAGDILSPGTTRGVADTILAFLHSIGLR